MATSTALVRASLRCPLRAQLPAPSAALLSRTRLASSFSGRLLSPLCRPSPLPALSLSLPATSAAHARMCTAPTREDIRNIAIVAHVDHGKTTLVDALMMDTDSTEQLHKDQRVMDSNDQERERGITILAKNAAVTYNGVKVNIVDTPGHADFGGEVERVLNMVDSVLLVVDAQEGPKPQTRFVLKKALALGHRVLVVVNKIDKPAARPDFVINKTFDLFCELGASDEQTDFNVVYTSAINRQSGATEETVGGGMAPLLEAVLELPRPPAAPEQPLQLQISNIGSDPFIGRLGIGRIRAGSVRKGQPIGLSSGPGSATQQVKISELFVHDKLGRRAVEEAAAGDIVVFSGVPDFNIGDTLVALDQPKPLEPIAVEKPTMSITLGAEHASLRRPPCQPPCRDTAAWHGRCEQDALCGPLGREAAHFARNPREARQGARGQRGPQGRGHGRWRHGAGLTARGLVHPAELISARRPSSVAPDTCLSILRLALIRTHLNSS
jgi:GTP-binding protein